MESQRFKDGGFRMVLVGFGLMAWRVMEVSKI